MYKEELRSETISYGLFTPSYSVTDPFTFTGKVGTQPILPVTVPVKKSKVPRVNGAESLGMDEPLRSAHTEWLRYEPHYVGRQNDMQPIHRAYQKDKRYHASTLRWQWRWRSRQVWMDLYSSDDLFPLETWPSWSDSIALPSGKTMEPHSCRLRMVCYNIQCAIYAEWQQRSNELSLSFSLGVNTPLRIMDL